MFLDLTDVFDTVDHAISLTCFEHWVGIRGTGVQKGADQFITGLCCNRYPQLEGEADIQGVDCNRWNLFALRLVVRGDMA